MDRVTIPLRQIRRYQVIRTAICHLENAMAAFFKPIHYQLPVASAQVKFVLIFAAVDMNLVIIEKKNIVIIRKI